MGLFPVLNGRSLCGVLIFSVAGLLGGCSGFGGGIPPAPAQVSAFDYSYVIGPGDSIGIIVAGHPELSMSVLVRPDGKISAPMIDELPVQGKNSVEVARDIEKALSKYVVEPIANVVVSGVVGPYSEQIRVIGEAAKPQFLPYKHKMTVLDVMIAVGGLTNFAAGNRATILRVSEGNKQYSVRLKDLVKEGDVTANVEMKPGDILIIPQSWF